MKNIALILLLSAALLLYGCAQAPSSPAAPPAAQPQAPVQIVPVPSAPPANPQFNNTTMAPPAAQQTAPSAECSVQFQKASSSVYYVMVNTTQPGAIKVTCPNGADAQKQGELYFCAQLDATGPTIAYLDGAKCGSANFSGSSTPPGKQSCTVLLSSSRISVGQTASVTVKAYVPQEKSTLSYLCGDREVNESAGGMVDTGKICQFNTPGTVEVYAKINGVVCASSTLTVFSTAKGCSVFGSAFRMDRGQYVYSANVSARGYSGTDYLRYSCYGIPHAIKANTIPSPTDFVTSIECRSASGPLSKNVAVAMGNDACGEMIVAQ